MPGQIVIGANIINLDPPDRYDRVSRMFHWTTLIAIVVVFATAWARRHASDGESAEALLTLHRSSGALLWVLTLARLFWKRTGARSPDLPRTVRPLARALARSNQYALYLLLMLQPAIGFAQSVARGKPFALLGGTVPAIMSRDKPFLHLAHDAHEAAAWALLALIGLHTLAALAHHFILRDGVLRAMLPGADGHHPRRRLRHRDP